MPALTLSRCDKDSFSAAWEATFPANGREYSFQAVHRHQAIKRAILHAAMIGVSLTPASWLEAEEMGEAA
jgi:hypothetical protein